MVIVLLILGCIVAGTGLLALAEGLLARAGPTHTYTNPAKNPTILGVACAPMLNYIVLGDSTAAGQGGAYELGIAVSSARHLTASRRVSLTNVAVSGAKTHDVLTQQLPKLAGQKPDIVLVAIGANDVIGLTSAGSVRTDLNQLIDGLQALNPNIKIVLTAAPEMGAPPRLLQPLGWLAGLRARQLNRTFDEVIAARRLTLAPILIATGQAFKHDATLFAADKFHPNDRGYALWTATINPALDQALAS